MVLKESKTAFTVDNKTIECLLVDFSNQSFLFITDIGKIASLVSVEKLNPTDQLFRSQRSDAFSIHSTVLLGPDETEVLTTVKKCANCFFQHFPSKRQVLISCSVKSLTPEFVISLVPQLESWFGSCWWLNWKVVIEIWDFVQFVS